MSPQPIKPPSGYVFYFAYGSNMAAATMVRRQFHPEKSVVCELPNYAISFNMFAIPYVEPAFATVYPIEDQDRASLEQGLLMTAHGVVHLIPHNEFMRIVYSEIGNGHKDLAYNVETVTVNALDSSESYEAVVLVTPREMTSSDHWPSRRYLDLCISGAVEQGLPQKYVEWMKNQPCYDPANKTTLQSVGSYAFGICFIPITMLLFFPTTYLAKKEIQAPAFLPMCVLGVARLGRGAHNYGFKHVFGSGTNHE
ncbi:hypothetical protein CcCBS67573_g10089 [Chytriomyces confervae]|uniref:gamma-glutamylcyclotransferase n=1 Tax=Chytriomyces confervae TaxID=246404 RepID=A0A507DH05_9FUNG|nr:hypothetical protein CcCBS67573_g10089 [Chytriomyces confervae]